METVLRYLKNRFDANSSIKRKKIIKYIENKILRKAIFFFDLEGSWYIINAKVILWKKM